MILLNESWLAQERRERRERVLRVVQWVMTSAGWVALGVALGWLMKP